MNQTTLRSGRRLRYSIVAAAVASLGISGCVPEDDLDPSEAVMDDEALGEAESTLCISPPPPSYDASRTLATYNDNQVVNSPSTGYGSGGCDYYGVRFINGDSGSLRSFQAPTSESACENTTLTAKFYTRSGSSWVHQTTITRTGVWFAGVCTNLNISANPGGAYDLLIIGQERYSYWSGGIGAEYNRRITFTGNAQTPL